MAPIPPPQPEYQYPRVTLSPSAQDNEQLNSLSLACTIVGIIMAVFFSFPLIHVAIGLMMVSGVIPPDKSGTSPAFVGWIFLVIGLAFVLFGWGIGGLTIYAGRCLKRREKKLLIQVAAGFLCAFVPVGTILGVFIFIVLSRPAVAAQFERRVRSSPF